MVNNVVSTICAVGDRAWSVFTDGGCPSNPGPGAWAFVVKVDGAVVEENSGFLPSPEGTNNQNEYRALEAACLMLAMRSDGELPGEVNFYSDSMLIVEQINGRWKVNDLIRPFYQTARASFETLSKRTKVSLTWIRRELNQEADALCNIVLDKYGIVCLKKGRKRD